MTGFRHYSEAEDQRIRDGFAAGETDREMGVALGRSKGAVTGRRTGMGLLRYVRAPEVAPGDAPDPPPWNNDINIGHDEMREYAAANKIAPGIDALNAFRRAHRLPEYRLKQRWSK